MPSACVRVRHRPPYHGDKMARALSGMGYRIISEPEAKPSRGDVLVLWNRYPRDEGFARAYEQAGANIVVVENGYFGRGDDDQRGPWYAMALDQHNGCGRWPRPSAERWLRMGIDLKPWRTEGREIVLLATRGMGNDVTREKPGWLRGIEHWLRGQTKRPVRIRPHPGPQGAVPAVSLGDDLRDAWAAITWGSSAGLKALALGVPVYHGLLDWIGKTAAMPLDLWPDAPFLGDREPMFHRVASAMWSLDEIESGEAFKALGLCLK